MFRKMNEKILTTLKYIVYFYFTLLLFLLLNLLLKTDFLLRKKILLGKILKSDNFNVFFQGCIKKEN